MSELAKRLETVLESFADAGRMGISGKESLEKWMIDELGSLAVLEGPVRTETGWKRARPLERIYHVCPGNLSISAETSLLISILLGAQAYFKLPSTGLPELERRVKALPAEFRERVHLLSSHQPEIMQGCDGVVVFGSNATVEKLRAECSPNQRFLSYGHQMSVGVVTDAGATRAWAEAARQEIIAYRQLGCLSPQSYLCAGSESAARFAQYLREAFEQNGCSLDEIPFEAQALIYEARQRARVSGDRVIIPENSADWTIVQREQSHIEPGPGFCFIEVVPAPDLDRVIEPWRGLISSVSFTSEIITKVQWSFWEDRGVHRLCRTGHLQCPPIAWPHDGRPRLGDLVTWVYADPDLMVSG